MRVMLTSCGIETDKIKKHFLQMLNKEPSDTKALFIPTAAIDADAYDGADLGCPEGYVGHELLIFVGSLIVVLCAERQVSLHKGDSQFILQITNSVGQFLPVIAIELTLIEHHAAQAQVLTVKT